ncbi:TIR domain-containing protein [Sphingomonas gellani]|uniref:TIR domain-containing protein n=1 Tax=Sphingomonas gellani TaxID=1166340 RepID=A0A1H8IQ48_9SPHN|nr:toll/interleukin-1 receptor domain-containing protein [Sphingomonas gellani]SEN70215.1 TIR domain-containing protein [Sphingomonas gellani]
MKKVATATKNMNSAMSSANRASSPSSAKSYLSTAERESKNIDSAQDKSARYSADIASKMSDLSRAQEHVLKGEEDERKKTSDLYEKQRKADEAARKRLTDDNRALSKDLASLRAQLTAAISTQASSTQPFVVENAEGRETPYDFFISHAWKDKEDFVNGLVSAAKEAGLDVWDDQSAIVWGDSIRQKIDDGLRRSFFGVVVLSPNFFERPWTQYELDGIVQRDLSGAGRLLPIWHRLTQDDVAAKAPSLAGRLALPTSTYSTAQIVDELLEMRDRFKAVAR